MPRDADQNFRQGVTGMFRSLGNVRVAPRVHRYTPLCVRARPPPPVCRHCMTDDVALQWTFAFTDYLDMGIPRCGFPPPLPGRSFALPHRAARVAQVLWYTV